MSKIAKFLATFARSNTAVVTTGFSESSRLRQDTKSCAATYAFADICDKMKDLQVVIGERDKAFSELEEAKAAIKVALRKAEDSQRKLRDVAGTILQDTNQACAVICMNKREIKGSIESVAVLAAENLRSDKMLKVMSGVRDVAKTALSSTNICYGYLIDEEADEEQARFDEEQATALANFEARQEEEKHHQDTADAEAGQRLLEETNAEEDREREREYAIAKCSSILSIEKAVDKLFRLGILTESDAEIIMMTAKGEGPKVEAPPAAGVPGTGNGTTGPNTWSQI